MRWFLPLLLTFFLVSCTKTSSQINRANGKGFAGAVGLDNTRPRCTFGQSENRRFRVSCRAMVVQQDGSEMPATSIQPGVSLNWSEPFKVDGTDIDVEACRVDSNQLSQECTIALLASGTSRVQFDLVMSEIASSKQKTESDVVFLPLSAESFGRVAALLDYQAGAGIQNTPSVPTETFIGSTLAVCTIGERLFFSSGGQIYVVENGAVKLFAGSTNPSNPYEYSHRLRLYMGGASTVGVPIACGKNAVYVPSPKQRGVFKLTDAGPVEHVAPALTLQPGTTAITVLKDETILIADTYKVWRVPPGGRPIAVAGTPPGVRTYAPRGIATDGVKIYIADTGSRRVWVLNPATGEYRDYIDPSKLRRPVALIYGPREDDGRLFIADEHRVIKRLPNGDVYAVAGIFGEAGFSGDGEGSRQASLRFPLGLAFSSDGGIVIADSMNNRIRKLNIQGKVQTLVGTDHPKMSVGKQYDASTAQFGSIKGLAIGPDDSIYAADAALSQVHRIDPSGVVSVIAGSGAREFSGDGGPATAAALAEPSDVLVSDENEIYVADTLNKRIRKIAVDGTISTVVTHELMTPERIVFGKPGEFYFSNRSVGTRGLGVADSAGNVRLLNDVDSIAALAVLPDGNVVFADVVLNAVKHMNVETGESRVIAGTGRNPGSTADGYAATLAQFTSVSSLVRDGDVIYVADAGSGLVRKLTPVSGGAYRIDGLLGGASKKDCSGVVKKRVSSDDLEGQIRVSLSSLCYSKPTAFAIRNHCSSSNPAIRHITLAVAQSFSGTSNVIRIRRPCP